MSQTVGGRRLPFILISTCIPLLLSPLPEILGRHRLPKLPTLWSSPICTLCFIAIEIPCRRDRQGRRGTGVTICKTEGSRCLELNGGADGFEYLWLGIGGKANNSCLGLLDGGSSLQSLELCLVLHKKTDRSIWNCSHKIHLSNSRTSWNYAGKLLPEQKSQRSPRGLGHKRMWGSQSTPSH